MSSIQHLPRTARASPSTYGVPVKLVAVSDRLIEWCRHLANLRRCRSPHQHSDAGCVAEAQPNPQIGMAERNAALVDRVRLLEAESRAKTCLFAAAIHDLRQPLQALMLFSNVLAKDEADPIRLHRIESVCQSVDSLDRLCHGLLELAQIDAGTVRAQCNDLPLQPLFEEVDRNFQVVAQRQGLKLVLRKTDAWVRGDSTMLMRILNNLVSNSLRNTNGGGILVGVRRQRGGVRIDVCDTGIGIAPQHQSRVFEAFYRLDVDAVPKDGRGVGLGLATVRRLIDLQGATVRLRSRPGKGTVVSVIVPQALGTVACLDFSNGSANDQHQ